MANLATLVGGSYAGTFNAVDIGITEDGFDLIQSLREEVVEESDFYGGSVIDYFYRGGNCQVRCDSKEFKPGSVTPYWPWGVSGTLGQMRSVAKPIARRASDVAAPLVLTGALNTPAVNASAPLTGGTGVATMPIATLTGTFAIMAPGQQGTLKFTSKLRRVPIFLQLLPYDASSITVWFITTAPA